MTQLTKSMWQRGEQGAGQHDDYGRRKTREAARQAAQSAKGREIGPIPPIANRHQRRRQPAAGRDAVGPDRDAGQRKVHHGEHHTVSKD